jgi:hypothetical protein
MLRNAVRGGYNAVIQVDLRPRVERSDPRQRWIEKIEADFAKRAQAAVQSVDSGRNGKSKHFSKGRIAKLHNWLETQADGTNLAKTDHAGMKNDDDTPFEDPTLSSKNCKFHVKTALNASNDIADSVLVSELAAEHLQSERYTLDTKILAARRNMSTNERIVIPPRSGRKEKLRLMRGGEREKCTPKTCVGVVDIIVTTTDKAHAQGLFMATGYTSTGRHFKSISGTKGFHAEEANPGTPKRHTISFVRRREPRQS